MSMILEITCYKRHSRPFARATPSGKTDSSPGGEKKDQWIGIDTNDCVCLKTTDKNNSGPQLKEQFIMKSILRTIQHPLAG